MTFIGLWTHVDDEGRCVDDPRLIKAAVWPLEDRTAAEVDHDLEVLYRSGTILRYTIKEDSRSPHGAVRERSFIAVSGWREHQKINRPTASKLPAPENGNPKPPTSGNDDSVRTHGGLTVGKEQGTGKGTGNRDLGSPSESRSPAHANDRAAALAQTAHTPRSHKIVNAYADTCTRRPPTSVLTQLAVEVDALLLDGWTPGELAPVLERWGAKGLHPKTLASVANEVANAKPRAAPVSPTDQFAAQFLANGRHEPPALRALPGGA
ncbi:hypothetical protein ACFORO_12335 [Amycolatopsis halotolerans]|uniref:Uncharacterized protein n=1 Tax=Amycolatopsis halotolerans TaxID=330083 RepID=A0ABV7QG12_9PSEU